MMYCFTIEVEELHRQYNKTFHYINTLRWKHRLHGYQTKVLNENFTYIIFFYKTEDEKEQ